MDLNQVSRVHRSGKASTSRVVTIGSRAAVQSSGTKASGKGRSMPVLRLKKVTPER
jgi:hypothetical protein